MELESKVCTKCNQMKDIKYFNKRPLKNSVGYRSQCKYCESTTACESYHRRKGKPSIVKQNDNLRERIKFLKSSLYEIQGLVDYREYDDEDIFRQILEITEEILKS